MRLTVSCFALDQEKRISAFFQFMLSGIDFDAWGEV